MPRLNSFPLAVDVLEVFFSHRDGQVLAFRANARNELMLPEGPFPLTLTPGAFNPNSLGAVWKQCLYTGSVGPTPIIRTALGRSHSQHSITGILD